MTTLDFTELVQEWQTEILTRLTAKGHEYAHGDRLSNFKRIAEMRHVLPEEALLALMAKHYVAVEDAVAAINFGQSYSETFWHEKLGDIICYCILLSALLDDRTLQSRKELPNAIPSV